MAYREVALHLHKHYLCQFSETPEHSPEPHIHCFRCGTMLFSMQKIASFRNTGNSRITRKGVPKLFCIPCGQTLSDSSYRPAIAVAA